MINKSLIALALVVVFEVLKVGFGGVAAWANGEDVHNGGMSKAVSSGVLGFGVIVAVLFVMLIVLRIRRSRNARNKGRRARKG